MRRGFTIHHNGPPANCIGKPHSRCEAFWQAVVRYHTEDKGWSGVAYSFGVCPHGERFEGQGWNRRQFANGVDLVGANDGADSEWYTVLVFVGGDTSTGDTEPPTREMVVATAALIEEGRRSGRCGNRVLPHNAFKRKPCPGPEFTELARQWDGQPITVAPPPAPEPEEPDMLIIDCPGKPALILGVGGVKRLSTAQRNALRTAGVEAKAVDAATSDTLWSLRDPTPVVDVDETAVAAQIVVELAGTISGDIDAAAVEAVVRRVFADAGTAG